MKIRNHGDINAALGRPEGTLVAHSFIKYWFNHPYDKHPVPDPLADHYLQTAPLSFPGSGNDDREQMVVFEPLEGLIPYLQSVGIQSNSGNGRAVILPRERSVSAPNGDLEFEFLNTIHKNLQYFREKYYGLGLLPVFSSAVSQYLANILRIDLLNSEEAVYMANNKVALRKNADKYGYNVTPGMEFHRVERDQWQNTFNDICEFVSDSLEEGKDIWMKYPTGSGGDLVVPIRASRYHGSSSKVISDAVTDSIVTFAYNVLMSKKGSEVSKPDIGTAFEVIRTNGLVVETGLEGEFKNYNVQAIIGKNGEFTPVNMSEQLTSDQGAYLGNLVRPAEEYPQEVRDAIWDAMKKLANYMHSEYEANMLFGADILVDKDNKATVIDLNGRFNGSTSQKLVAAHLDIPYSLNVNINLPFVPETFHQVLEVIGKDLLFDGKKESGVLPKMPRRETGVVKVDILGSTPEVIHRIREMVIAKGIKI